MIMYRLREEWLVTVVFLFCAFAVSGQNVRGKVMNTKGEALASALIEARGEGDAEARQAVADEKGRFELRLSPGEKQRTLRVSCLGHEPVSIVLPEVAGDQDLGEIRLAEVATEIGEVEVKARENTPDRTFYYPGETLRKHANDAYELIAKLMLPGIKVNMRDRSLSGIGKEKVAVYINDKEVKQSDLLALRPDEVTRVEFVDVPGAEYGHADMVIKFILKRRDNGWLGGINLNTALTTLNGQNFGFLKYNKGESEWTLSANSIYTRVKRRNTSLKEVYRMEEGEHVIDREGLDTPLRYYDNSVDLGYNLTRPKRQVFDITLTGSFYDSPKRENRQRVTETGRPVYWSLTAPTEHYLSTVANLFYKQYIGERQTLTTNLVYSFCDTDYGYRMTYYADEGMTDETRRFGYDTKGKKHSLIAEARHSVKVDKLTIESGVRYLHGHTRNRYTGSAEQTDRLNSDNLYLYGQVRGKIRQLSYVAGVGVTYRHDEQQGIRSDDWVFRPTLTLSLPIRQLKLAYSFMIRPAIPSLAYLSDVTQRSNAYEYLRGNPYLNTYHTYWNQLKASLPAGRFYFQNTRGKLELAGGVAFRGNP